MSTNRAVDQEVRIRPATFDDLEALHSLDRKVSQRLAYPYFVLRQLFDLHVGWWLTTRPV